MIEQVRSLFGDKSTGIKLNPGEFKSFNKPTREIKFCEAVKYSFEVPVEIDNENNQISVSFGCPESRKFGGVQPDEAIIGIPYHIMECLFGN